MKQRLFIVSAIFFLIIAIIGLNAVSYTQKDRLPDMEIFPNRSTYNPGSTGTRAFYELLDETGRNVMRRRKSFSGLSEEKDAPKTLVITGNLKSEIEEKEFESLFKWISQGGQLVIIDRTPAEELLKTTGNYRIHTAESSTSKPHMETDPADIKAMTDHTAAAKPVQPTIYTHSINAVQPSRFASSAVFEFYGYEDTKPKIVSPPPPAPFKSQNDDFDLQFKLPPSAATPFPTVKPVKTREEKVESVALNAPFVHLSNGDKNILIDFPFGEGKIVWLTDPYIVSNAGIGIVDNLQAAINIVGKNDGVIAFDEYHQGYGEGETRLMQYFAETPVIPIFLQAGLILFLILLSQSRRFARALPEGEPGRLSKLEYVSAFAELQRRTKAYDLAIENIYSEFRRKSARLTGTDSFTVSREELAELIAERGKFNELEIYNLMKRSEEIIRGDRTNKQEVLRLTTRIREIEDKLNLKRSRTKARN